MNLGERILDLRTKANMSQNDFADVLNVSRQSVSKWETNSSIPDLEKLMRMSEIFNISLDELVRGEMDVISDKSKETSNKKESSTLEMRKIVGFVLLGVGTIIFVLILVMGFFYEALVLASPFFIVGLINIVIKKYSALWSGWVVWLMVFVYIRYATGIRIWWIFVKWVYRDDLILHAAIAWGMTITLGILIFITYRTIKAYRIQTAKN